MREGKTISGCVLTGLDEIDADSKQWVRLLGNKLRPPCEVWEVLEEQVRMDAIYRVQDPRAFAEAIIDAGQPLLILDSELRVEGANESFYEAFPIKRSETQNRLVFEIGNGQWNIPGLRELLHDLLPRNAKIRNYKVTNHFEGLGCRVMLLNASRLIEQGELGTIVLTINDITEQSRTGQSRMSLGAVVESLEDSIVTLDLENTITGWNRAAEKLYGYTASEAIGKSFSMVMIPDDLKRVFGFTDQVKRGGAVKKFDTLRVRKGGEQVHLSIQLSPIKDVSGRIVGVSTLARDIGERKRVEDAMRASEARFRTLAQTIPQLVWTCASDGACDYLSPQWGDYTGIPSEEQLGQKWVEAVHPDDRAVTCERWKAASERRTPFDLEYRLRNAKGEYRWFQVRGTPILDVEGKVTRWFGTCTDIEHRKRTQEELEKVVGQRTATLQETVSELEAFSYSMIHDMRAPLRAMNSFAQILCEGYASRLDDPGREMIDRIRRSAERLDLLIQDVLNYSRVSREAAPISEVDLDRLLGELIPMYPDWSPPHAQVQIRGRLGSVLGHIGFLTQCISNLIGNGIKFHKPGVKPLVEIWTERRGDRVRLNVRDNGIGIAEQYRARVFGMLERLHPTSDFEGTGIGLAIVRRAVERIGGTIDFESQPGKGSTFWIELAHAG